MALGQKRPIGGRGIGRPIGWDLGTPGLGVLTSPPAPANDNDGTMDFSAADGEHTGLLALLEDI